MVDTCMTLSSLYIWILLVVLGCYGCFMYDWCILVDVLWMMYSDWCIMITVLCLMNLCWCIMIVYSNWCILINVFQLMYVGWCIMVDVLWLVYYDWYLWISNKLLTINTRYSERCLEVFLLIEIMSHDHYIHLQIGSVPPPNIKLYMHPYAQKSDIENTVR